VQDFNYRELIANLGISPGSMLMVTADLTRLAIMSRRKEVPFNTDLFIDTIQNHLGNEGTLIIPAFNFNLKNKDYFNPAKSIPITGALAVAALQRPDFRRTRHPLHSFLVWGRHADDLVSMNNLSSFDKDSPFAFMKNKMAVMLLIDTSITAAFTFVHHVEEMEKVQYRKYRQIWILLDKNDDKPVRKGYLLYAKRPGWTMSLEGLEAILLENQVAKQVIFKQLTCTLVDLAAAYPVIKNEIINSDTNIIARFSLELYLREKAKSFLAAFGIHTLADKISHDPGLL